MGIVTSKSGKSGSNLHRNTYFNGGTQVSVPGTRHKYHRPRRKKILDDYGDFNNYVVVGSLRDTNDLRRS